MADRLFRRLALGRAAACRTGLALALLLPGACARSGSGSPIAWWHQLEGGRVAQQRPPPPGADQPYPNLAIVPAKPAMPDPGSRAALARSLAKDRADAQYEAAANPLVASPPPPAPAAAAPRGEAPPAMASFEAASGPPPAPGARPRPARAPVPAGNAAAAAGPETLPDMPLAPPPPPRLSGVAIPVTRPVPPPLAPTAPARPAPVAATVPVALAFAPGSAIVTLESAAALRGLARRLGGRNVMVTGFGEAQDATPQVQAAALSLALARARAAAAALTAEGVPMAAIRIDAEASGRGAAARLLD